MRYVIRMVLKKASPNRKRDEPVSFRLSREAFKQLETLAKVLGKSKTEIVEESLAEAYSDAQKAYPSDFTKQKM